MKEPINSEVSVESFIFNDWRDWFLTEEDKKISSLVLVNLYVDDNILVGRNLAIPRNFSNLDFVIVLEPIKNITISKIILEISEMEVLEERKLDRSVYTRPGDTININFQISHGEIIHAS